MPPIEIGPKGTHAPRALDAVDHRKVPQRPLGSERAAEVANARSAVVRSRSVEAGEPPVDAERVAEIARAIEQDRYPVLPVKVADAIIAAGLLLRSGK